jgi:hypothetical protein
MTAVKKDVDAAAGNKATEDAAVAERMATDKRAADATAVEKATSDMEVTVGTTTEVASRDVAESSPTSVAGAKRSVVSGGFAPHAKRWFRGSWKPRYDVGPCICPSFLLCLFCFTWILCCAVCLPPVGHLPPGLIRCMVVPWSTSHRWCR